MTSYDLIWHLIEMLLADKSNAEKEKTEDKDRCIDKNT